MDAAEYCREVETYLCRKNGGHLVRIVGPSFAQVCGWAIRGVPLSIALRGIDQCCERSHARGPRRRPVRIEFCEADILDLFDAWRRAVGVGTAADPSDEGQRSARKTTLPAHIERATNRLIALRTSDRTGAFKEAVTTAAAHLDRLGQSAQQARGDERAHIVAQLAEIDERLMQAAVAELDASAAARLRREAEEELAPFGGRLAPEARAKALDAAYARLVRETLSLPALAFDPP